MSTAAEATAVSRDDNATVDDLGCTFAMLFFGFKEGPRAIGTTEVLSVRLRGAARPDTKGRASAILLLKEIAGVWVIVSAIMMSESYEGRV